MATHADPTHSVAIGHSADVEMTLRVGHAVYSVLQASKSAIKVDDAAVVPQGDALLHISIDGRMHRWPIRLLPDRADEHWILIEDR